MKSVSAIVTGFENSGTTVVSSLIMSARHLFGGFECGLLLGCPPRAFDRVKPFREWLPDLWDVDKMDVQNIVAAKCHQDAYEILLNTSRCLKRAKATSLLDKTPRYIYSLDEIMTRAPGVKVVLVSKDRAGQLSSWAKRGVGGAEARDRYELGMNATARAQLRFPSRIHQVHYRDLEECRALRTGSRADLASCARANRSLARVFHWLGFTWDESYLTLSTFCDKLKLCGATSSIDWCSGRGVGREWRGGFSPTP